MMDTILKSLRTAIEMARATLHDPAYVARRLEEIEWGVDALLAENARLNAVVEAARELVKNEDSRGVSPSSMRAYDDLQSAMGMCKGEGE